MWECRTAHAHSDIPHLVRATPRHPANASRHVKKFRVKQKIVGSRASGVGSDFVIDDGTEKTLEEVVGVTE